MAAPPASHAEFLQKLTALSTALGVALQQQPPQKASTVAESDVQSTTTQDSAGSANSTSTAAALGTASQPLPSARDLLFSSSSNNSSHGTRQQALPTRSSSAQPADLTSRQQQEEQELQEALLELARRLKSSSVATQEKLQADAAVGDTSGKPKEGPHTEDWQADMREREGGGGVCWCVCVERNVCKVMGAR